MATNTVTGVFSDGNAALRAAERVREVAGLRASVRVLVRGQNGSIVETAVLSDRADVPMVALSGLLLGLVTFAIVLLVGGSVGMSVVGLLYGVGSGVLLGVWLTGEQFRSRRLRRPEIRAPYESLVSAGKAVLTVITTDSDHAASVRDLLHEVDAEVYDGFLHPVAPTFKPTQPLPG